jgi:hypothetical protein
MTAIAYGNIPCFIGRLLHHVRSVFPMDAALLANDPLYIQRKMTIFYSPVCLEIIQAKAPILSACDFLKQDGYEKKKTLDEDRRILCRDTFSIVSKACQY